MYRRKQNGISCYETICGEKKELRKAENSSLMKIFHAILSKKKEEKVLTLI
jgi:hypothetical protein